MRLGLLLVVVALVAACGGATAPGGAPAGDNPPGAVTRADFGADWPFASVESGVLRCEPGSHVVFRAADGTDYAINGSARGAAPEEGWRDGVDLLSGDQVPADMHPLVDRGLKLCD